MVVRRAMLIMGAHVLTGRRPRETAGTSAERHVLSRSSCIWSTSSIARAFAAATASAFEAVRSMGSVGEVER
jgi:hypothetical protein